MSKVICQLSEEEAATTIAALTAYVSKLKLEIWLLKEDIAAMKAGAADGEKAE